jgi:uncharacterized protein YndB with AHSA1/START domain
MSERIVSASITIDAPPDTVFAILADPRRHSEIDGSGTVRAITGGPTRLELGSRFGADMKLFGAPYKIRNKVVEFEEGSRIAWRHIGPHRWRYELEPTADGGTHVTETWDATYYPGPTGRWLDVAGFPERTRTAIEGTLVKLKAAAEARDAS